MSRKVSLTALTAIREIERIEREKRRNENIKVVITFINPIDGNINITNREFDLFLSKEWIKHSLEYLKNNRIPAENVIQIVRTGNY